MKRLSRQNHNDKPGGQMRIFSRPASVKSSIPQNKKEIKNKMYFTFAFLLYFFHHSSCRKDQFTVLIFKFGIIMNSPGRIQTVRKCYF